MPIISSAPSTHYVCLYSYHKLINKFNAKLALASLFQCCTNDILIKKSWLVHGVLRIPIPPGFRGGLLVATVTTPCCGEGGCGGVTTSKHNLVDWM